MNIRVIPARALTDELAARWLAVRASNPELDSPYFTPDYFSIVAQERDDVELALIEQNGEIAAFFPFQRERPRVGAPVGGGLCDFQGVIAPAGFHLDWRALLHACDLHTWDFSHLLASQTPFAPHTHSVGESPAIDLSEGFKAYVAACPSWKAELRKLRKLERELGPLRFELQSSDLSAFDQILSWKSGQYLATGLSDGFANVWVRGVVSRIWAHRTEELEGVLSLLYAGDRLVAGHIGMRSRRVMHWWFPAYDPDPALSRYSPGLLILYKVAEALAERGVQRIDLGLGQEEFKMRMKNASITLAQGSVQAPSLLAVQRRAVRFLKSAVADSALEAPLRRLAQIARRG